MANIYLLLFVALIFWYFIYLRKVAEVARIHAQKYCKKEKLQYLSIARISSKIRFNKKYGIYWLSQFDFEFSGDGESQYQGQLTLAGYKLEGMVLPAYRVSQ